MLSCAARRMDTQPRWNGDPLTPLSPGAIAGQATFSGCIAKLAIAVDALASRIPPGAVLAANDGHQHACLIAFGEQAEGMTFFGGWPMPWGIRYHELLVGIPLQACGPLRGPQLFVAGMTCDFWPAVWNGNFYYGFRKRFAPMTWGDSQFAVMDDDGAPAFLADVAGRRDGGDDLLAWVQGIVALPVLGKRDDGVLVQSRFDWDFTAATIDGGALTLDVRPGFDELPASASGSRRRLDAAIRVDRMRWSLSWPTPTDRRA